MLSLVFEETRTEESVSRQFLARNTSALRESKANDGAKARVGAEEQAWWKHIWNLITS